MSGIIAAFLGGAGKLKTYSAFTYNIKPLLDLGTRVITNIPLDMGNVMSDYPNANVSFFSAKEDLLALSDLFDDSVIIIDDCHLFDISSEDVSRLGDFRILAFVTESLDDINPDVRASLWRVFSLNPFNHVDSQCNIIHITGAGVLDTEFKFTVDKSNFKYFESV